MRLDVSLFRAALLLIALLAPFSFFAPSVSAQQKEGEATTARNWPAGYGIAVMGIVLGLLIVLRPGTRGAEEAK